MIFVRACRLVRWRMASVDDMVGAERADQLDVADAAHAGDVSAEGLGDLHGERADASR